MTPKVAGASGATYTIEFRTSATGGPGSRWRHHQGDCRAGDQVAQLRLGD